MADFRGDQAAGLRRLLQRPPLRVVTFVAGSLGVGKSVTVANVAASLAGRGCQVLVVDENTDDGVAAFYGTVPAGDLQQVVERRQSLAEVLLTVAPGVRILPAGGLIRKLARLSAAEQDILLQSLREIVPPADVVLVDTSLGHPLAFSPLGLAAPETVIVVAPNVAAITAAYALIKRVSLGYARRHFRLLVSMTRRVSEARAIYDNMARVTGSHRLARLDYAGCVPVDERLRQASRLGQPVAGMFPDSPAASAYQTLSKELLKWPAGEGAAGGLEPFVQQLLQLSQHIEPAAIYA